MTAPFRGRQAEAERNHERILDAAREVFLADPSAPISAVAARAGVGISALYRRYDGKEDLLRSLAADGLERFSADLRTALDDDRDPWTVYSDCVHRIVEGRSQALAQRLAGTFTPTHKLDALAAEAHSLYDSVHRRAQRAKVLRRDVTTADVTLLLEMVMAVELPSERLRLRYLAVMLQALRAPAAGPLPRPAADDADLAARWRR